MHLLVRCGFSRQVRIRDLDDDPLHQFWMRCLALIGMALLALVGLMLVAMIASAVIALMLMFGAENAQYPLDAFLNKVGFITPWALIVSAGILVDKVSRHRAAARIDSTAYRSRLKALLNNTADLDISEGVRQTLNKALIRYSQAETDYREQARTNWLTFARTHKFDEIGLAKASSRLFSASDAFIASAKKAIETSAAKHCLTEPSTHPTVDQNDLKRRIDALWTTLSGDCFEMSQSGFDIEIRNDLSILCAGAGGIAAFITSVFLAIESGIEGLSFLVLLTGLWALISSLLCHASLSGERTTRACLAWNLDQALPLIRDMATTLLRDGHGQPSIRTPRDAVLLPCLAAMYDEAVEPQLEEVSAALYVLTDRFVKHYRDQGGHCD